MPVLAHSTNEALWGLRRTLCIFVLQTLRVSHQELLAAQAVSAMRQSSITPAIANMLGNSTESSSILVV